ncbi:MAG: hypothetical protein L0H96_15685 [Humibacillus sp.]|nr:hypothetical protein [Humibacillus sp.]
MVHTVRRSRAARARRAVFVAAAGAAVALVASSCTGGAEPAPSGAVTRAASSSAAPTTPAKSTSSCTVSDKGVPTCGVLWGVATRPPTAAGVKAVEAKMGRPFDFVYRYHDLNDTIPDKSERAQVAGGQLLHVSIAARDFSHPDRSQIGWADVAAGTYDEDLRKQAEGIASLKVPVFVTFEQEASQKGKVAVLGSPETFVKAWKHVHDLYQKAGVTNAVWVWVMTGSADNLDNAAQMWPGNDYVDWISWNVYNQSGCKGGRISEDKYVSFEDKMRIFYDFIETRGPSIGMDPAKPKMISETGSARYPDNLKLTADWYAAIPSVLQRYPTIKAVSLWDSINGGCDYRFDQVPELSAAVAKAGMQPIVHAQPDVTVP